MDRKPFSHQTLTALLEEMQWRQGGIDLAGFDACSVRTGYESLDSAQRQLLHRVTYGGKPLNEV